MQCCFQAITHVRMEVYTVVQNYFPRHTIMVELFSIRQATTIDEVHQIFYDCRYPLALN